MEKVLNCVKCTKAFKVMNEAPKKPSDVPETNLSVACPFCETKNPVTWPQGTKYTVAPK
jgi:hypothetical protein